MSGSQNTGAHCVDPLVPWNHLRIYFTKEFQRRFSDDFWRRRLAEENWKTETENGFREVFPEEFVKRILWEDDWMIEFVLNSSVLEKVWKDVWKENVREEFLLKKSQRRFVDKFLRILGGDE